MRQTLKETVRIARERHTLRALMIAGALATVALVGAGYVLAQKTHHTDATASRTADIVTAIQAERRRNTLLACEQSNREHSAIVGFITSSIPKDRLTDPRVKQYLELANASFPVQNCAALVKRRVPSGTP